MSQNPHPARSPEFLSRLHDQDLSPAERAHFESHRAHCAECRTAAAEFEAALALFRSSSPRPASPDLAARILRKLQQSEIQSRRIRRFGPTFGIDLRWAGAFAVAVIAAIVGSSIVFRNEARERALRALPVSLSSESSKEAPAAERPKAQPEIVGSISDSAASRSSEAAGGKRQASFDALRPALEEAPRRTSPADKTERDKAGQAGWLEKKREKNDEDQKEGARRFEQPNDPAFGKQKTAPQKLASAETHAYAPAPPPAAVRPAEKDREESAASSSLADRGQAAGQVVAQSAPEARSAQENRVQAENERKRTNRQQPAKGGAASNRGDISMNNQAQADGPATQNAPAAPAAAAQQSPRDAERAGGEGGNVSTESQNAAPLRLLVSSLDGAGAAPDVVPASAADLPNSLRGQEFVVVVDLAGRVQQVTPKRPELSDLRRANETRLKKLAPPSPLAVVRFQPGSRQRRLLVKVE